RNYSRRVRAVLTFLKAPVGKPVDILTKLTCLLAVFVYTLMYLPIVGLRDIGLLRIPDDMMVATRGVPPSHAALSSPLLRPLHHHRGAQRWLAFYRKVRRSSKFWTQPIR